MPAPARIALDSEDGVTVVRFLDRQIMDDRLVREAFDQLDAAIPASQPLALILDLSGVNMISSAFIGKIVLLERRAQRSGGLLRLCELSRTVADVLHTTNLDRVLKIARDRREAREAFEPKR